MALGSHRKSPGEGGLWATHKIKEECTPTHDRAGGRPAQGKEDKVKSSQSLSPWVLAGG